MPLNRELFDAAGHNAPDFNRLAFFWDDIWKSRIGGFKFDTAGALIQVLDGEISVDDGDHDMVMTGFDGTVHHQNIFVKNARIHHGLTAGAQEIGSLRMHDQHLRQVDAVRTQILRG